MKLYIALFGGINCNSRTVDIGLAVLRVGAGLALCTIFEKFLPRDGVWGPQAWFINDVAKMGFPLPAFFAWCAVLSEFFGGIFMVAGFLTRPAAFLNAVTTFVAAFVYHKDIGRDGVVAAAFFVMTLTLLLAGPGRFSLDGWLGSKLLKEKLIPYRKKPGE
jgi:putative oxidoreductase